MTGQEILRSTGLILSVLGTRLLYAMATAFVYWNGEVWRSFLSEYPFKFALYTPEISVFPVFSCQLVSASGMFIKPLLVT